MKWPELVPNRVCTDPCRIFRTKGLKRDGSHKQLTSFEGNCHHVEKSHAVLNAEKQLITLSGTALFNGDIAPGSAVIEGSAEISGRTYIIYSSEKAKNPDGTVNYTRLELL